MLILPQICHYRDRVSSEIPWKNSPAKGENKKNENGFKNKYIRHPQAFSPSPRVVRPASICTFSRLGSGHIDSTLPDIIIMMTVTCVYYFRDPPPATVRDGGHHRHSRVPPSPTKRAVPRNNNKRNNKRDTIIIFCVENTTSINIR